MKNKMECLFFAFSGLGFSVAHSREVADPEGCCGLTRVSLTATET